jgi:hypothetical protein
MAARGGWPVRSTRLCLRAPRVSLTHPRAAGGAMHRRGARHEHAAHGHAGPHAIVHTREHTRGHTRSDTRRARPHRTRRHRGAAAVQHGDHAAQRALPRADPHQPLGYVWRRNARPAARSRALTQRRCARRPHGRPGPKPSAKRRRRPHQSHGAPRDGADGRQQRDGPLRRARQHVRPSAASADGRRAAHGAHPGLHAHDRPRPHRGRRMGERWRWRDAGMQPWPQPPRCHCYRHYCHSRLLAGPVVIRVVIARESPPLPQPSTRLFLLTCRQVVDTADRSAPVLPTVHEPLKQRLSPADAVASSLVYDGAQLLGTRSSSRRAAPHSVTLTHRRAGRGQVLVSDDGRYAYISTYGNNSKRSAVGGGCCMIPV